MSSRAIPRLIRLLPNRAMLLPILVSAGAAFAADQTRLVGGLGGSPFVERSPGGRVGTIAINAGALVDSIGLVYEAPDGQRSPWTRHGGSGGSPCIIPIAPSEEIIAIRGRYGTYIESIQIITNHGRTRICGGPGGVAEFRIDVPPNHVMVGFVGRSGQHIDAIGLALAPVPPGAAGRSPAASTPPPPQ